MSLAQTTLPAQVLDLMPLWRLPPAAMPTSSSSSSASARSSSSVSDSVGSSFASGAGEGEPCSPCQLSSRAVQVFFTCQVVFLQLHGHIFL